MTNPKDIEATGWPPLAKPLPPHPPPPNDHMADIVRMYEEQDELYQKEPEIYQPVVLTRPEYISHPPHGPDR